MTRHIHQTVGGLVVVGIGLTAMGCGGSDSEENKPRTRDGQVLIDGFDLPAAPSDALEVVSPEIPNLESGTNIEFCFYSGHVLEKDTTFRAGQGYQSTGGHHVVAYWTDTNVQSEGYHECTEADMTQLHVLSGGGGEAGNGIINDLPAGGAFKVPAGAQIVLNVHALNTTSKTLSVQAATNLYYGDASLQPLTSFYVTGTDFQILPNDTTTYSASCVAPIEMKVARLLGHMHEWGTRNQVSFDAGSGTQTVYDEPGAEDFSYNPPYLDYTTAQPLVIAQGTTITVTCTWKNPGTTPLAFPSEMCAAFGYVLGDGVEQGCADGKWNTP